MAEPEPPGPFYESRWFKGAAAVVALLVSLAALSLPLRGAIDDLFSASDLPRVETEIVFDRGSNMNAPFGDSDMTKLAWAKQDVARTAIPYEQEGLALRTFGGGCATPGNLLVDFGANHGDDVTNEVDRFHQGPSQSDSDLSTAVKSAIDDFTELPSDTTKQVIVYVGTLNQCGQTSQQSAMDIRSFMLDKGVKPQFRFIGVDLSPTEQQQLKDFRSVLPGLSVIPSGGATGQEGQS